MNKQGLVNRRDFLKYAGSIVAGTLLASCAPKIPPTAQSTQAPAAAAANPTAVPAAKEVVTIRHQCNWLTETTPEYYDMLIGKFQEKNPDIKINWIKAPPTPEVVISDIASGNPVDLIHAGSTSQANIGSLAPRGHLKALDPMIAASSIIKLSDYYPEQWDYVKYKDTIYGVPSAMGGSMPGMVWHNRLFEEIGVDPDKGPQSWDDILSYTQKLTKFDNTGAIDVLGFEPNENWGDWTPGWCTAGNVIYIDKDKKKMMFDQPRWVEIFTYFKNHYAAVGGLDKVKSFWTRWDKYTGGVKSGFANGHEVMQNTGYFTPADLTRTLADKTWKVGYDWLPTFGEKTKSIFLGSHQIMMLKYTKIPEQTFRWMEYIMSLEANLLEYDLTGNFMWSKPLVAKMDVSKYPGLDWWMKQPNEADRIWSGAEWTSPIQGTVETVFYRALEEVAYGKKQPEDAVADMNKELQVELDRANAAIGG
jgi:ABC-type glycerol-3-phosphate transport system substrate-binding protein